MSQRPEIERKSKRKEEGSARCSPPQYLLFPFLLFSIFFVATSTFLSPPSRFPFFFSCVSAPLLFSSTSNSSQLYIWSCFGTTATSGPHVCRQKQQSKSSRYNELSQEEGEAVPAREEGWRGEGMHKMKTVKWDNVEKSKAESLLWLF